MPCLNALSSPSWLLPFWLPCRRLSRLLPSPRFLGNPSAYDGKHVDVSGTVEKEQQTSHKGNPYITFSLCSGQCIHVFAFGSPSISDGRTITVQDTYEVVKHVSGYTFYNEIDVDDGSL